MQLKESISRLEIDPSTEIGSTLLASAISHKVKSDVIKIKIKAKIKPKEK